MGFELNCLKNTMFGVIIVYLIFGIVTLVTGSVFMVNSVEDRVDVYNRLYRFADVQYVINKDSSIAVKFFIGAFLSVLGGIGICIAILGIVGTYRQNTCLIMTVVVLLLLMAFVQFLFGVTAITSGTVDDEYISKVQMDLKDLDGIRHGHKYFLESIYISHKYNCCMEDACRNSTPHCAEAIVRSSSSKTSVGSGFAIYGGIANVGISLLALLFIKAINRSKIHP